MNQIDITTWTQAEYHLSKGELILFHLEDGMASIGKESDEEYIVTIQPTHGSGVEMIGDIEQAKDLFTIAIKDGREFFVIEGCEIKSRDLDWIDKLFEFIRKIFSRNS